MPLTKGFTTGEENYVAVCGFLTKLYPFVVSEEGRLGIVEILKEVEFIYPSVFKLKFVEGNPILEIIEETVQ
jgi:hypothetical protein